MWLIGAVLFGVIFSEFVGYWLHRLIHSGKIEYLSTNHMEHHLREYGPRMSQRTENYKLSNVAAFGSLGLEWWIPISAVAVSSFVLFLLLGLSLKFTSVMMIMAILWGVLMFAYMHDALHIKGVWMLKDTGLFRWFKETRRLHNIHHIQINDEGRMDCNFGICMFWMDKLFGTYRTKTSGFNKKGFEVTKYTYAHIYGKESDDGAEETQDQSN